MALKFTDGFEHYEAGLVEWSSFEPTDINYGPPSVTCKCGKSKVIVEGEVLLFGISFRCCGSGIGVIPDRWEGPDGSAL